MQDISKILTKIEIQFNKQKWIYLHIIFALKPLYASGMYSFYRSVQKVIGIKWFILIFWVVFILETNPDLEKAASGTCGHFVENPAILRTFWVKIPAFLIEDGARSVDDGK